MRLRVVALPMVVAALSAGSERVAAAVCDRTGEAAPAERTFMASKRDPVAEAWIVNPDCTTEVVGLSDGNPWYFMTNVARVASVPSGAAAITMTGGLSRGGDFTAAKHLERLQVNNADALSLKDCKFPAVSYLAIYGSTLENFAGLELPMGVKSIRFHEGRLKTFKNIQLPSSLEDIQLYMNQLTTIDFAMPPNLQFLNLLGNPIKIVERIALPDTITQISLDRCQITTVRGIKLPSSLTRWFLSSNPITTFEIRASDLPILRKLEAFDPEIDQPKCADASAQLVAFEQGNVCVISDERFESLYGPGSGSSSVPAPGTAPSGGSADTPVDSSTPSSSTKSKVPSSEGQTTTDGSAASSSDTESSPSSGAARSRTTVAGLNNPSNRTTGGEDEGVQSAENGGGQSGKSAARTATPGTSGPAGATTSASSSSTTSTTVVAIIAVVGTLLVLFGGAIGYRVVLRSKNTKSQDVTTPNTSKTYSVAETPQTDSGPAMPSREPTELSTQYMENDIRNDTALSLFRIDGNAVRRGGPIARGGYGIIYKGEYAGEVVAIKQMLPDTWRDETTVASFMDEIRMCVKLDHPKIVHCVGISWTSLRDLSVVIEYMDGGDLHSVLQNQSAEPTGREWTGLWTESSIKSKASIASDVVEAIVYLHSFQTPIIHRDLKAKNVLLDSQGNAKLSDFGISREVSMDETMTREVGTVAWIAPEVLRGDRYTEQADIYSLGVLLVEMDRCRHPYSREDVIAVADVDSRGRARARGDIASQAVMKNTRIAILVSTGKLRPTPTASCPDVVKQLMERCLAFEAADRPSAMEVSHALRQIRATL